MPCLAAEDHVADVVARCLGSADRPTWCCSSGSSCRRWCCWVGALASIAALRVSPRDNNLAWLAVAVPPFSRAWMQGRAGRLRSRFPGIGCGGQKKANNQASSSSRLAHFAWVFCLSAEQQRPEEKKERKKESWRGEESAWGGGLCACLVMKKRKMSFNGKGVLVVWLGFWFERCLLSANTRVLCVQRCNHKRVRRRWLVDGPVVERWVHNGVLSFGLY